MGKKAIIVESPTKTRTLGRFLGDEYTLLASKGHVRDLPSEGLAVDVEHNFAPEYETIPRQVKTLKALKDALKGVDEVYLASDPDREGEAIAWHLAEALKLHGAQRIEFNEITEQAVREALAHPRELDMDLVNAQQARRVLDRLVGYGISPLLYRTMGRGASGGLSAGRVQSVALRLIVDRERERLAFVPVEYWTITARLSPEEDQRTFTADLKEKDGVKFEQTIGTQEQAAAILAELQVLPYTVGAFEEKDRQRNAQPPLITSTLQRAASGELSFSAKKTMLVAQQLYEGVEIEGETVGLITYMRTDSTHVAPVARDQAVEFVTAQFGSEFVGPGVRGKTAKGAQEAHECIRPSSVLRLPEDMQAVLDKDQARLYELIWRRFVASQMAPAVYHQRGVDLLAGAYLLRATSSDVVFPGWMAVLPDKEKEDANKVPPLTVGQPLQLHELTPAQHFTQPPPRFTEASLVEVMEEKGIGRPSTYAPTIETLRARDYVRMEQRQFAPTALGFAVCDYLLDNFPSVMDVEFTAHMEEDLDTVEQGERDWVALLGDFYGGFEQRLTEVKKREPAFLEGEVCPDCGGRLRLGYSALGKFARCEKHPECSYLRDLSGFERPAPEVLEELCPQCGGQLSVRQSRFGKFIGCANYPECKYTQKLNKSGEVVPPPTVLEEKCPDCGSPLVERQSRRGPFVGCSGYPKCRYIKGSTGVRTGPVKTELPCEDCGKMLVLRKGRRGPFLGCSGYPKCRFTREATPEELAAITPPVAAGEAPPAEE
ncbi:MAG TPA: type I DNA topoisomerase [Armatimonadota bacterium]